MDRWMDRSSYRVTWLKMQFYEFPGVLSPGLSQKILILQFAPDFWRSFRHFRCGKLAFFHVRSSLGRMIAILTHTWDVLHRNLMITWWETSYQTMNERSLPKYFCIQNRKWRKMYLTALDRTKIFIKKMFKKLINILHQKTNRAWIDTVTQLVFGKKIDSLGKLGHFR